LASASSFNLFSSAILSASTLSAAALAASILSCAALASAAILSYSALLSAAILSACAFSMAKIAFLSVYEMSFTLTHELKLILATLSFTGSYIIHQFCPATIFGIVLI